MLTPEQRDQIRDWWDSESESDTAGQMLANLDAVVERIVAERITAALDEVARAIRKERHDRLSQMERNGMKVAELVVREVRQSLTQDGEAMRCSECGSDYPCPMHPGGLPRPRWLTEGGAAPTETPDDHECDEALWPDGSVFWTSNGREQRNAGPWVHDDGSPCPTYWAPFATASEGRPWWCPSHQQHVHAKTAPCSCGAPESYSLNPAEVVVHRRDEQPCYIAPAVGGEVRRG